MVFLSHGDAERAPLLVGGNDGNDFMSTVEVEVFVARLKDKNAKLYLFSCHTGKTGCKEEPTFCDKLAATQAKFVAPVGFANLKRHSDAIGLCIAQVTVQTWFR
jgi:hypothetical protein